MQPELLDTQDPPVLVQRVTREQPDQPEPQEQLVQPELLDHPVSQAQPV